MAGSQFHAPLPSKPRRDPAKCQPHPLPSTNITVCLSVYVYPSCFHGKPYTVVTAWRYEGSAAPVPWRALGDMLFEMGACSCSVAVEKKDNNGGLLPDCCWTCGRAAHGW